MDLVGALKLVAIVASGFFGVLGLATDVRNKETGKLTGWGVLSLIGVVVSSSVAFAIQYMESAKAEIAKRKAADETLSIVKNTQGTLSEMQRLLTSIDDPKISITFRIPCENARWTAFCNDAKTRPEQRKEPPSFETFPDKDDKSLVWLRVKLFFFHNAQDADAFLTAKGPRLNVPLTLEAGANSGEAESPLEIYVDGDQVYLGFQDHKASIVSDGSIVSFRDMHDASVIVMPYGGGAVGQLVEFFLTGRNGSGLRTGPFVQVKMLGMLLYRYDFKK